MVNTIPLTQLRPRLPQLMARTAKYFDRFVITRHGKPEAVLIADEDYEGLMETLDILSDPALVKEIGLSLKELKSGKALPLAAVKKRLGYV